MFKLKSLISIFILSFLLIGTSVIKNQTREIEKKIVNLTKKINLKEKDLNEAQLDYFYLTSPFIIDQKIEQIDQLKYLTMEYSNIYLSISDFLNLKNKVVQENQYEKKIQKKKKY